jgi:hypothetical protein
MPDRSHPQGDRVLRGLSDALWEMKLRRPRDHKLTGTTNIINK